MYYLARQNLYLSNFENPDFAYFSDRFCDRWHFAKLTDAIAASQALSPQYGSLSLVEEDDQWLFSHLAYRFDLIYRDVFPTTAMIRAKYHPSFRFILWEVPNSERIDLIYYHLSDRSVSFFPIDDAQCHVSSGNGFRPIWTGLNGVFIDPKLRTKIEDFSLHLWSVITQYQESLNRFERAQKLR